MVYRINNLCLSFKLLCLLSLFEARFAGDKGILQEHISEYILIYML